MPRSIMCAVGESDSSNEVAVGARLSGRLGLGLVLTQIADGHPSSGAEGTESLSIVQTRPGDWLVVVHLRLPRVDPEYWLSNCHGFLVDSPAGEVGVIDDVYFGRRRPRLLIVASRWFGRSLSLVPVEEVIAIYPAEERIVLAVRPAGHAAPPGRVERFARRAWAAATARRER